MRSFDRPLAGAIGSAILMGVRAALAAEAPEEPATGAATLEEVVVTAQKRSKSVQSVPISVTVLSNEELTRQGTQTIQDLSRMSASLEFTTPAAAPGGGAFILGPAGIRGSRDQHLQRPARHRGEQLVGLQLQAGF